MLDTTFEITKLIKKWPKFLDEIKAGSPGIRMLCPTRWTMRAETLESISENYRALQLTWDAAKEVANNSELRARITGVANLPDLWKRLIFSSVSN